MRKKKLPASKRPKRVCFLCFEFTVGEFTEEQVKICAEHWLDAKNCPNWKPVDVYIGRKKLKKVIWVDVNG